MSTADHGGYGYADYGYSDGPGVPTGGYASSYISLSGPGATSYYAYYSGDTKYVDYGYENQYGGKSTYSATLSPGGDVVQTTYRSASGGESVSDSTYYRSFAGPSEGAYNAGEYHQISTDYQAIDTTSQSYGSSEFLQSTSFDERSYFNGSSSTSYAVSSMSETNGEISAGSYHGYVLSSYTDPAGDTSYHIGS